MTQSKMMRLSLPDGGTVIIGWSDDVSLESLELTAEVLAVQLNSVRKAIERRKAADLLAAQGKDQI